MTHMQVSSQSPLKATCVWRVREYRPGTRLLVAEHPPVKNVMTNDGLTNLAGAWQGTSSPPIYLSIESTIATVAVSAATGATSIQLNERVDLVGDNQIIVGLNSNQETLTFSTVTTSSPWIYTLSSPTTLDHTVGDLCVRKVLQADTQASLQAEVAYDPTNNPGQRKTSLGGYSPGNGQWTMQFFFSSTEAKVRLANIGLCDTPATGTGKLHHHVLLNVDHSAGTTDLEVDATLTVANA